VLLAIVHVAYVLLRSGRYTVSADAVGYTLVQLLLGFAGTASAAAAGLVLAHDARKTIGRLIGLTIAILPQVLLAAFKTFSVIVTDLMFLTRNSVRQPLWNFNVIWLALAALLVDVLLVAAADRLTRFIQPKG